LNDDNKKRANVMISAVGRTCTTTKACSHELGFSESMEEYRMSALKWPADRKTRTIPRIFHHAGLMFTMSFSRTMMLIARRRRTSLKRLVEERGVSGGGGVCVEEGERPHELQQLPDDSRRRRRSGYEVEPIKQVEGQTRNQVNEKAIVEIMQ
jgi:hypothetical protein